MVIKQPFTVIECSNGYPTLTFPTKSILPSSKSFNLPLRAEMKQIN